MKVDVILLQPAKVDGKIVMPDGKPISVTPDIRDQLIASGVVVMGDQVVIVAADAPKDIAVRAGDPISDEAINTLLEKALAEQAEVLNALKAEELAKAASDNKSLAATLYEAENEAAALRSKVTLLEAQLAAPNPQDTPPSEKTAKPPQKGAAAKKG
ncbi:hypothetical protein [Pseudorhodobacter sp.]|uniref:hypothetical protein n=1 Tax=Pseudorhodobacter sp. TaxID=1934400 RepID=UPI00264710D1|nr:hypothetical protein [Pseudorhodobacter sp.]MDN5786390.1 hypothetical protein [Pseudorhodobacter sp.]